MGSFEQDFGSCEPKSLCVVDLRALQSIAGIDVHRLPRRVEVERAQSFAVAIPGLLDSSKWQVNLSADRRGVDISNACFEIANRGEGAVDVLGVERSGESVVDGIRDFDGFLKGRELDQRNHRTEDLFAG